MAKIVVVDCDRCKKRIRNDEKKKSADQEPLIELVLREGDKVIGRDLCAECRSKFMIFMSGAETTVSEKSRVDEALASELRDVRKIANEGIEAYADGASPEALVSKLRDVASAARRN